MPGGLLNILVFNGGSSSIKFSVFAFTENTVEPRLILDGELSGMGTAQATLAIAHAGKAQEKRAVEGADSHAGTIGIVLDAVTSAGVGAAADERLTGTPAAAMVSAAARAKRSEPKRVS